MATIAPGPMTLSVFDLFTIGIGPSSSHTIGPMRAARLFAEGLDRSGALSAARAVAVELYGSLGLTGRGHGSDRAVVLGLEGETPEGLDPSTTDLRMARVRECRAISLLGRQPIAFDEREHLVFHRRGALPLHPNGMRFRAMDTSGRTLTEAVYYSLGGGFVVSGEEASGRIRSDDVCVPYPFASGADLLAVCERSGLRVSEVVLANERERRPEAEVRARLSRIWAAMQACVRAGCARGGELPGGLRLRRRAPALYRDLTSRPERSLSDPLAVLDWVDLYALAVNEENAAGGRVVTAPTNGSAGIVPAALHYYDRFCAGSDDEGVVRFLLAAGAVGILYKENASISGAEVGCQGEVGVACSMAAAGLAEALGGTPAQVENAAEIAMEHNLGLTCDPVGGLVQIPCIERNAMGAVKAINAARMALHGDGRHHVSLDAVIATMRQTGADMKRKYKETSQGGLAVNYVAC
ncbi:MAG TPA: L-serine ammonia-lyase [Chthonomonadales bacterium]|nr:L-serine ammonia-lyase [Chthonomonadales bacterium]